MGWFHRGLVDQINYVVVLLYLTISVHGFSLFPNSDTSSHHQTDTAEELIQDTRPVLITSKWTEYGSWSSCSRSCGSGIQERKRTCFHKFSHELRPDEECPGEPRQVKLCKEQDCPPEIPSDFRKEECGRLSTTDMIWKPLYYPDDPAINPCWLGCYSNQATLWKIVAQEVPDGTSCVSRSGPGVCINNECRSYGCDRVVGSTKERDICGVCDGDGMSCQVVASTKIVNHLQVGYNEALDIPSGARSVKVFELSGGKNYLALCEPGGRYLINGNYRIDNSRLFVASGSLCSYQRLESLERNAEVTHREMFTCAGPLNKTVTVMVLTRDRSASYLAYEYTLPLEDRSTPTMPAEEQSLLISTAIPDEQLTLTLDEAVEGMIDKVDQPTTALPEEINHASSQDGRSEDWDESLLNTQQHSKINGVTALEVPGTVHQKWELTTMTNYADSFDNSSFEMNFFIYEAYSIDEEMPGKEAEGLLPQVPSANLVTDLSVVRTSAVGDSNSLLSSGIEKPLLSEIIKPSTTVPSGDLPSHTKKLETTTLEKEEVQGPILSMSFKEEDDPVTKKISTLMTPGPDNEDGREITSDEDVSKNENNTNREIVGTQQDTDSLPQLKFEVPEKEVFVSVTLGIYLAELVDPKLANITIDNKISSKTGNVTGDRLNVNVIDGNRIPNYHIPIPRTPGTSEDKPGRPDVGGHTTALTELTSKQNVKGSEYMKNNNNTTDMLNVTRTTTETSMKITEDNTMATKTMARSDGFVTPSTTTTTTTMLPTTPTPTTKSMSTLASTTGKRTTTSATPTTTVATTTIKQLSTVALTTPLPSTTTQHVTTTIATTIATTEMPDYIWKVTGYSSCQVTCGRGVRMEYAYCVDQADVIVADNLCNPQSKPEVIPRNCGEQICDARWEVGAWSSCSVSCGGGMRFRTVSCWWMEAPGEDVWVPDRNCDRLDHQPTMEECGTEDCILEWRVGEWSSCSEDCGEGQQTRVVQCSVTDRSRGYCDLETRPADTQTCEGTSCQSSWSTSPWSSCSGGCQTQTRRVNCYSPTHSIQLDSHCSHQRKPLSIRLCGSHTCVPQWIPQTWNQDNCGNCQSGYRYRETSCQGLENGRMVEYDQDRCSHLQVPIKRSACNNLSCNRRRQPRWYTTKWAQCSVTCGNGQKRRKVRCYENGMVSRRCDSNYMPPTVQSCSMGACPVREVCTDNPAVKCNVIRQANLCRYHYYTQNCCQTCSR